MKKDNWMIAVLVIVAIVFIAIIVMSIRAKTGIQIPNAGESDAHSLITEMIRNGSY